MSISVAAKYCFIELTRNSLSDSLQRQFYQIIKMIYWITEFFNPSYSIIALQPSIECIRQVQGTYGTVESMPIPPKQGMSGRVLEDGEHGWKPWHPAVAVQCAH